ncbi:hypothetical protein [Kitasatospora sp. NPDC093679]|uniref:hypothetical protein n=1 Tax=Kitasatospora sp. NPDC093679 TaxID=3154983 RepID=UPI00342EAE26
MPAETVAAPTRAPKAQAVHPANVPRDTSNDLLVLNLQITEPSGVLAPLTLAVPAPDFGTAPWQLVHVAAYVNAVRERGENPTNSTAYAFLAERVKGAPYPYRGLHDARVTCQVDVLLGPLDDTGWPALSLVVLESEEGKWGFARRRRRVGAASVAKLAHLEIAAEHSHLCAGAAKDSALADRRDRAQALMAEARGLEEAARVAVNTEGARKARAAAIGATAEPEPGASVTVQLDPDPARLETLTGRVLETGSVPGRSGEVGTRFYLAPDRKGEPSGAGPVIPQRLICNVRGEGAKAAAQLPVGRRVIVVGRLVQQTYVPKEQPLPRQLMTFDVHALGPDLLSASLT